ncbi:hypothetical protein PAAL109150_16690 [Paenibacillus alkaliterrae]
MAKVDRRILKSQESMKKAVIELMTEKNFDDITIQDIADRANINRGTIYLHYQDKFDLLDKLIETHINGKRQIPHTWKSSLSHDNMNIALTRGIDTDNEAGDA